MVVYCGLDWWMDCVVQEVNARVHAKGLELLSVNGGRLELNNLLFCR